MCVTNTLYVGLVEVVMILMMRRDMKGLVVWDMVRGRRRESSCGVCIHIAFP